MSFFAMTKTAQAVFQILTSQPSGYSVSLDKLAQLSGVSRQGVKRAIAWLEEIGLIIVTRTVENGRNSKNMYQIIAKNAPK
ncbi:HTH domain-containing protein [Escherichia coli]|uniref:HTH domain-containing protein n=2 Tax=Escherichia coli TaxID=562 RepID=UPI001FCE8A75|nr:helix-turn-helix domain-containing protein [Escherichia coli]